ncbi:MAG TPA: ECF-type sigma factor [Hyphomicrobiales bacterium]|nr:ECF-type sigma factor [Hyphomicrobiales bacterium]
MTEGNEHPASSVTTLLGELGQGGSGNRLPERIYRELRRVAAAYMRRERADHTLQATALVHEAWMRLRDHAGGEWQNRAHFFASASHLMREILVDHARRRRARKRGGEQRQITLTGALAPVNKDPVDVLALDEALQRLSGFDPRAARIVELRFFGDLSFEEIAQITEFSLRTVKNDWAMARAWLRTEFLKKARTELSKNTPAEVSNKQAICRKTGNG